ncbi:MAG: FAD-binding domain-containing protein [Cyanobacteriota bacterium]|nr:FAD-binding domain-containing protein [Cyanobacteriota bacterium]
MGPPSDSARGGRRAAELRLAAIDPARYAATRNHLDGAVTRLSPYIRHGVVTLAEVRDAVLPWGRAGEKLINELGWRDYWQRLWQQLGDGIWHNREPLKTGHPPEAYAPELPADIAAAATGLACIDGLATELIQTGWLHNHARLWLASYLVHWRRLRWQAGARWFLQHLLDGDPASNNLSWQWVASSFSTKPYIFNRANLERFSSGRYCANCPKALAGCPFEASYEVLQTRLFRHGAPSPAIASAAAPGAEPPPPLPPLAAAPLRRPLVWVHGEALGPANPALRAHPTAAAVFVFDRDLIAGRTATTGGPPLAPGRLRFLRECLAELPLQVREGEVVAELLAAAAAAGADGLVSSRAVDPRFGVIAAQLAAVLPLQVLEPDPFVPLPSAGPEAPDLRRFSRYWRRAEPLVWASAQATAP